MSRTIESRLKVSLIDSVSATAKRVGGALDTLRKKSSFQTAIGNNILASLSRQQSVLGAHLERNKARAADLRGELFGAGAAFAAFAYSLGMPIHQARELDRKLTSIQQKLNASPDDMDRLRQRVQAWADAYKVPLTDVAEAVDTAVGKGINPMTDPGQIEDAIRLSKAYADKTEAERVTLLDAINMNRSLAQNLKIEGDARRAVLDAWAEQGKSGSFEMADAARHLPMLSGIYSARGYAGQQHAIELNAMLQTATLTAKDADMAANDVYNLLSKLDSPETIKKFNKLGVDIRKELKEGLARGEDPFEQLYSLVNKALKGDFSKIGDIWQDMQAQNAARALILNREKYQEFKRTGEEAAKANTIQKDLDARQASSARAVDDFTNSLKNLSTELGGPLLGSMAIFARSFDPIVKGATSFAREHPALVTALSTVTLGYAGLRVAALGASLAMTAATGAMIRARMVALAAAAPVVRLGSALLGFSRVATVAIATGGITTAFSAIGAGALAALNPVRLLRGALWVFTRGGAIGLGIAALATLFDSNKMSKFFDGFGASFKEHLSPEAFKAFHQLGNVFERISNAITPSAEGMAKVGSFLGEIAGGAFGGVVSIIDSIASALSSLASAAMSAASGLASFYSQHAPSWAGGAPAAPSAPAAPAAPAISGARAEGGPVIGGRPYLVGERGPEIFTPGASGQIIPNGARAAGASSFAPTVNISVSGKLDEEELSRRIMRRLEDLYRASLRATHADLGFRWA